MKNILKNLYFQKISLIIHNIHVHAFSMKKMRVNVLARIKIAIINIFTFSTFHFIFRLILF
jgi:hypothetical protein